MANICHNFHAGSNNTCGFWWWWWHDGMVWRRTEAVVCGSRQSAVTRLLAWPVGALVRFLAGQEIFLFRLVGSTYLPIQRGPPSLLHSVGQSFNLDVKNVSDCAVMACVGTAVYSAFGKSLCTYKRCWRWCPWVFIQVRTCLILFANTFCISACKMLLMYAVIAVFNSLSVHGRSRYTDNQFYVP
jgi:hypothetical protein